MGPNLKFSPVSTTMECILNLTLQYIVIYTALGICRTVLDFQGVAHKSSQVRRDALLSENASPGAWREGQTPPKPRFLNSPEKTFQY